MTASRRIAAYVIDASVSEASGRRVSLLRDLATLVPDDDLAKEAAAIADTLEAADQRQARLALRFR